MSAWVTVPVAGLHLSEVQLLASSRSMGRCTTPNGSSHVSIVQRSLSSSDGGAPGLQAPLASQRSAPLQIRASEQEVPAGSAAWVQAAPVHWSRVHALPSSHCASLVHPVQVGSTTCATPTFGSQLSTVHGLPSPIATGSCRTPTTGSHVSTVHGFWSSRGDAMLVTEPVLGSQRSTVQGF